VKNAYLLNQRDMNGRVAGAISCTTQRLLSAAIAGTVQIPPRFGIFSRPVLLGTAIYIR
jgi:hypothetical protein